MLTIFQLKKCKILLHSQGIQKLPLFCHLKIKAMTYMFDILPLQMKSRSVDMRRSLLILRATTGHQSDYPLIAKTGAGHLPVSIFGSPEALLVKMTQGRVEFLPPFNASQRSELASALGMSESDFADLPIQVVTTGHSKVMVPMLSRSTLDGLTPNNEKLKAMSAEIGCNGFFPFVLEGSKQEPITYGRMFAPAIGINEDPVTGNANGPAGAYLVHHDLIECDQKITYWGYQGLAIQRPGRVLVTVEKTDSILHVSIAGQAVLVGSVLYSRKD